MNKNNGFYERGKCYGMDKKLSVAAVYFDALEQNPLRRPNLNQISRECKVGWHFVEKIEREILGLGKIQAPEDAYVNRVTITGSGAKSIDKVDAWVLLMMYIEEPTRSLASYVQWLFVYTGTFVSTTTVSRVFKKAFPFKGSLVQPNLVPYDKFRPANVTRAKEYLKFIAQIDPRRIKYGDEKLLKGQEIFNKKVRRHPLTGIVPATFTTPDFRNTYSIIGFCGINKQSTPVKFRIHEGTNNAELFADEIEWAIVKGFLVEGDVLVLDNAAIHVGKENSVLEDWLWQEFRIFVLFLPARTPEWNPIELMWNALVQRLKAIPLNVIRSINKHAAAKAAEQVLKEFTHDDIAKFYETSGVFNHHE